MNKFDVITDLSFVESEAQAAIGVNPNLKWAKFIFTDDQPNGNKMRIPLDEFPNIIKTGVFMPIKMASGEINDGHEDAKPLGVISNLKQSDNLVEGLAAFWTAEREDDINLLKAMTANDQKPQVSWEVWYDTITEDEQGIQDLHGVVVRASTIVGRPAYKGRTPILAMSSLDEDNEDEELKMDMEQKIVELEAECQRLRDELAKAQAELETAKCKDKKAEELEASLEVLNQEVNSLREFKAAIEKIEAEASKLSAIKGKFTDAGISKSDEYFVENKDKFLALEESALDFMLQEMVSLSKATVVASLKQENKIEIPNLPGEESIDYSNIKELARLLKQKGSK